MERSTKVRQWLIAALTLAIILYCAAGLDYSGLAAFSPSMGMDVEEPSGGVPVFVWIILAVVVIGGGAAAVIIVRKKKAAKLAQLEDSDEDI